MTTLNNGIREPPQAKLNGGALLGGEVPRPPGFVVAAVSRQDRPAAVWAALRYARDHGLRVAPQTTGHLGQALPDLSRARAVRRRSRRPRT